MSTILIVLGSWFALSLVFTLVWALLHLPRRRPVGVVRRSERPAGATAPAEISASA